MASKKLKELKARLAAEEAARVLEAERQQSKAEEAAKAEAEKAAAKSKKELMKELFNSFFTSESQIVIVSYADSGRWLENIYIKNGSFRDSDGYFGSSSTFTANDFEKWYQAKERQNFQHSYKPAQLKYDVEFVKSQVISKPVRTEIDKWSYRLDGVDHYKQEFKISETLEIFRSEGKRFNTLEAAQEYIEQNKEIKTVYNNTIREIPQDEDTWVNDQIRQERYWSGR